MALHRVAVAAVLALNAYVIASGIAALTRDVSVGAAGVPPMTAAAKAVLPCAAEADSASAGVILSRNAFDSETGPLDVAPIPIERLMAGIARARRADPLNAPVCAGVIVLATAELADPRRSTAVLRGAGEGRASVRRVRDRVGDGVVTFIGENPLDARPAVWIDSAAGLCQARLFASPLTPSVAVTTPQLGASAAPASVAAASNGSDARTELLAGIRPLGPTLVQVDRAAIDPLFERYEQYAKLVGTRSETRAEGERRGLALGEVNTNGVLARFGFRTNDRIVSVAGHPVGSLEAVFSLVSRLKTSSQVYVEVERDSRRVVLEIAVR